MCVQGLLYNTKLLPNHQHNRQHQPQQQHHTSNRERRDCWRLICSSSVRLSGTAPGPAPGPSDSEIST